MLNLLRILLVLVGCASARAQPRIAHQPQVSYPYLLHLPDGYGATQRRYPLLIYLHGGSQSGTDLNKLKTYGPTQAIAQGLRPDCIVVSPQCPQGKYWSTDNWFEPLYARLVSSYRIDTNRVYLTGISMGGYGTWQTAVAYPTRFAAIAPLCDDSTQLCRIKHVPVWTFHGTADDLIPIDETQRLVRRLARCPGPDKVLFTRLPGQGHAIQYLYQQADLYEWLLQQHK